MFALALWDRSRARLLLARDRFGIKPLFFQRDARRLVFASEIKALLRDPECPRAFDWDAALANPAFNGTLPLTAQPLISGFEGIE